MSRLRINRLIGSIQAEGGDFEGDFAFGENLTVLRAENTSGKTAALNGIMYALGLERALGPRAKRPLPGFFESRIEDPDDSDRELPVVSSHLMLEIEGYEHQPYTCYRQYKGSVDSQLVYVCKGESDRFSWDNAQPFYVGIAGAARAEHGFHRWLSALIGWQLPIVITSDGREAPLYLELLFSLLFVEQSRGWSGIQANIPVHYGIRHPGRKSIEFLLDLDAPRIAYERDRLQRIARDLSETWKEKVTSFRGWVEAKSGRLEGVPAQPLANFDKVARPRILLYREAEWSDVGKIKQVDSEELSKLQGTPIRRVGDDVEALEARLREYEERLQDLDYASREKLSEHRSSTEEVEHINSRVQSLQEDLQHYTDLLTLHRRGAYNKYDVAFGRCPTCTQEISDALYGNVTQPLSLEQNAKYIREQIKLFEEMRETARENLRDVERELEAIRKETARVRGQIRSLRTSLSSGNNPPDESDIKRRVLLEQDLSELQTLEESILEFESDLYAIGEKWRETQESIAALPSTEKTEQDNEKLDRLSESIRSQASEYGFSSFPSNRIDISDETYRPTESGYEIGFKASASDNIRLIWSYYTALFELSDYFPTNHPGILVFDEPRQQEAKITSFDRLLERVRLCALTGQQAIVATSEEEQRLKELARQPGVSYMSFTGRLFQRVHSPDSGRL